MAPGCFLVYADAAARPPYGTNNTANDRRANHNNAKLRVATAANFSQTLNKLGELFFKQTDIEISASTGSTGSLYAQIVHGAPYDVFLSADEARTDQLRKQGLIKTPKAQLYACGRLALVRATGEASIESFKRELASSNTKQRISIANPKTAPYGAAAKQVLSHLLSNTLEPGQIVTSSNAGQAYQLVSNQQTEWGLVSLSAVINTPSIGRPSYLPVPVEWHQPIRQTMAVLNNAEHKPEALAFLEFMQSTQAKAIIADSGYLSADSGCEQVSAQTP